MVGLATECWSSTAFPFDQPDDVLDAALVRLERTLHWLIGRLLESQQMTAFSDWVRGKLRKL
jgi:hypothetical protein